MKEKAADARGSYADGDGLLESGLFSAPAVGGVNREILLCARVGLKKRTVDGGRQPSPRPFPYVQRDERARTSGPPSVEAVARTRARVVSPEPHTTSRGGKRCPEKKKKLWRVEVSAARAHTASVDKTLLLPG